MIPLSQKGAVLPLLGHINTYHFSAGQFLGSVFPDKLHQELMNRHGEKERLTSVPILCQITLQKRALKGL